MANTSIDKRITTTTTTVFTFEELVRILQDAGFDVGHGRIELDDYNDIVSFIHCVTTVETDSTTHRVSIEGTNED